MISRDTIDGLIVLIIGMLIFKSSTYLTKFEQFLQRYAVWVIAGGIIVFLYRKKIIQKIIGE